jgi:hypothetical protein
MNLFKIGRSDEAREHLSVAADAKDFADREAAQRALAELDPKRS